MFETKPYFYMRESLADLSESLHSDPTHDTEKLSSLFDSLDRDNSGTLSLKEFRTFVRDFYAVDIDKVFGGDSFVKSLFDEIDTDVLPRFVGLCRFLGNGTISKEELKDYLIKHASRYATSPTCRLVDSTVARVFREAPSFYFDSGVLHVLMKHSRNTSTKEIELSRGRAAVLHTDNGYALLFTGTHLGHHHSTYEVLLLRTDADVEEKKGVLTIKLDDKHSFKNKFGTPHTKSIDLHLNANEDVNVIRKMLNGIACKRYTGWSGVTAWWDKKSNDEKFAELHNLIRELAKENAELKERVTKLEGGCHKSKHHDHHHGSSK